MLSRLQPAMPQFTLTEHGSCCLASPHSGWAQSSPSALGARLNTPKINILEHHDCFLNADRTTTFVCPGGTSHDPAACSPPAKPGSEDSDRAFVHDTWRKCLSRHLSWQALRGCLTLLRCQKRSQPTHTRCTHFVQLQLYFSSKCQQGPAGNLWLGPALEARVTPTV